MSAILKGLFGVLLEKQYIYVPDCKFIGTSLEALLLHSMVKHLSCSNNI